MATAMTCDCPPCRLLDEMPVRVWHTDPARHALHLNQAWREFLGDAYAPVLPLTRELPVHPDDAVTALRRLRRHLARRESFTLEFRLRRSDGAWRWMHCAGQPRTGAGRDAGFVGACLDVTDRHEAEARQQHELADKIAVTQELHHRVKNNAQVFASLLSVQANRARDPSAAAALRSAAARAGAMASTQQRIWDHGTSARFDLAALIHRLVRTHQAPQGAGAPTVAISARVPATLHVPLSIAVPLGLILHELLVNARQHGFPDGRAGRIVVSAMRIGATLAVAVVDDGVGMPDAAEHATTAVGLTIVRSLVRQLDAHLHVDSSAAVAGAGTTVSLEMSCPAT